MNQSEMTEQMNAPNQWAERCSQKLDMVLARLDAVVSMLFFSKEVLTADEAAMYLGLTKSTFYKVARKYSIRYSRPTHGKKYYKRADLDEWLRTHVENTGVESVDN
jgi:excisionase family DNA binding protein